MSISPAKVCRDATGAPYSEHFGDVYASRDGAASQAEHVFLAGCGLPGRWADKTSFVVLENGFGLGTNFLVTWQAWQQDPRRSKRLHFVSIEKHPVSAQTLLAHVEPRLKPLAQRLAERWPKLTPGVHQLRFGPVTLTLYFMDVADAAKRLACGFDALYLDGFSPRVNPQMWAPKVITTLARYARDGATAATWCVARQVRDTLARSGFEVQRAPGFGHKREMTRAIYAPRYSKRRHSSVFIENQVPLAQDALIIGAGLAGAAMASELTALGWDVTVIDQGAVPATGASAIPWALMHPQPASDDNALFRLTRAGLPLLNEALESYPGLQGSKGVFQMARDSIEEQRWQQKKAFDYPEDFLQVLSTQEAGERLGLKVARGGFWHPDSSSVAAASFARARLYHSEAHLVMGQRVAALIRDQGRFVAYGAMGQVLGQGSMVILAAGAGSRAFLPNIDLWQGRISLLTGQGAAGLPAAVTGPGYAINSPDGWTAVGATYEKPDEQLSVAAAHAENLGRLKAIFPELSELIPAGFYQGLRAVSPDRLPLVGPTHQEGVFALTALGSRGLILSDLCARIIASRLTGEPAPVSMDLLGALDPNRYRSC